MGGRWGHEESQVKKKETEAIKAVVVGRTDGRSRSNLSPGQRRSLEAKIKEMWRHEYEAADL